MLRLLRYKALEPFACSDTVWRFARFGRFMKQARRVAAAGISLEVLAPVSCHSVGVRVAEQTVAEPTSA